MRIHTVETIESCLHEVVLPPNFEYVPLKAAAGPPAKEYRFSLDPFQREAIACLQNNQSVLVSAHTSAGKTVVAEFVEKHLRETTKLVFFVQDTPWRWHFVTNNGLFTRRQLKR